MKIVYLFSVKSTVKDFHCSYNNNNKKIQSAQSKRFYDDEISRKFWNKLSWLKQEKNRLH